MLIASDERIYWQGFEQTRTLPVKKIWFSLSD
jgi:hypothetical protein